MVCAVVQSERRVTVTSSRTTPPSPERNDPSSVPMSEVVQEALLFAAEILRQPEEYTAAQIDKFAGVLERLASAVH